MVKKKGREGERKREVGRGKQVEYGICVNSCSCSILVVVTVVVVVVIILMVMI